MATKIKRRNGEALRWIRASLFAATTGAALTGMGFSPAPAGWAIAIAAGVVALFAPGIAVLVTIIAMGLPMLAADFLAGAVFLVIGFAAVQYLGQDNGRSYLLVAAAFAGAVFGPVWAAPVIAGYLLGASEGAVAAILACLFIEGAGIMLGREAIGVVHAGGAAERAVLDFSSAPAGLLSFGWLSSALESINPESLLGAITGANSKAMLLVQPALWAGAAVLAGSIRRPADDPRRSLMGFASVAAGVVALMLGSAAALSALGPEDSADIGALAVTAAGSLIVALGFSAVWEYVFPPVVVRAPAAVTRAGMSAEDADVDELLRLIATAEDQLAAKHTTRAVVMITDMKSFSKMTEEEGSYTSAKTIQRHRDLLLPIIERFGGHGKSTGGDGLVAAFETPLSATTAAATMQRTLAEYNASHPSERDIVIRIGVASGEVVLDKGGRPFIGTALNLAARVMNLGDGGQALVTREVADGAGAVEGVRNASHGTFELKNIAEPVEVVELLWSDGQEPQSLGGRPD